MEIGLTEDNIGKHLAPAGYDRGGSFIAGGLNAEDIHDYQVPGSRFMVENIIPDNKSSDFT
jgi:hypothetical protein